MAREPLGITFDVPSGQEATGVYEDASGIEVFVTDAPYLTSDGRGLQAPLPVFDAGGPVFMDSMGNAQASLAVAGLEPSYDPDASALFARFATPPTSERKTAINKVIVALKAASAWEKLDVLYIRAAADSQVARLNWKGDFFNSTAVSSPAFTPDRGFTPDGAASYLSSGFNPAVATGALFSQDDAHMGAWHLTDLSNGGSTSYDLGNGNSRVSNSASANTALRGNMDTTITLSGDDYTKHKVWTRDGATSWRYFNDGALVGGDPRTDASVALTNFEFGTGRVLSNGFGLNTEAISHWGASLSPVYVLAMRDAFAEYLQAVGAI